VKKREEPLVFAAAALLLYCPALLAPPPPVDQGFLEANALLRLPWAGFWSGLLSRYYFILTGEATYQPLITLLHYLTAGLPSVFHVLVVGAHAFNAWLLFVLARRLGLGDKTSWLAGLLLAAFPPATEAVAVPSFAGHIFGLTATLSCVVCWLCAQEGRRDEKWWLAGSYSGFIAGLLCKETVVVAPALLALCRFCDVRPAPWRKTLIHGAGFPVLAAGYLAWRFSLPLLPSIPAPHRADWMLSLGWYARMLAAPWPLCFEHAGLPAGLTAFAGLFVLVGSFVVLKPALLLGWGWIVLELLPYLHFIPFAHTSPVADRYLYFAAAGYCLLLGQLFDSRKGRIILAVSLILWSALTLRRNVMLADGPGLCEQTGACAPDSAPAQIMVGNSRLSRGLYGPANEAYLKAVAIDPSQSVAWSNLGISRCMLGDYDGGIEAFEKSLALLNSPQVRSNLENARKEKKKATSAAGRKPRAGPSLP
jgi:hypothetical protein